MTPLICRVNTARMRSHSAAGSSARLQSSWIVNKCIERLTFTAAYSVTSWSVRVRNGLLLRVVRTSEGSKGGTCRHDGASRFLSHSLPVFLSVAGMRSRPAPFPAGAGRSPLAGVA